MKHNKKPLALIIGNHAIDQTSVTLEHKALRAGFSFSGDRILLFDQAPGTKIDSLVTDIKYLPLSPVSFFNRKDALPEEIIRDSTYVIFENSLRNYARRVYKTKRKTVLDTSMYREKNDTIVCTCIAVYISLLEILYARYDSVVWFVEKTSQRTRQGDVIATQIAFPDVQVVWV
jgi:hypothetical protein